MSVPALSLNPHVDAVETELFEKQSAFNARAALASHSSDGLAAETDLVGAHTFP